MSNSIFPIHLSQDRVQNLLRNDRAAIDQCERCSRYAEAEFFYDGVISADKTLKLSIHANTDNGFIMQSGQIYSVTHQLSDDMVQAFISDEILRRAEREIMAEDMRALRLRIMERAEKLKEKFNV